MAKKAFPEVILEGTALSAADLKKYDIFADVNHAQLSRYPGAVALREYRAGEPICKQGEGGTTAFYILEGECSVHIQRRETAPPQKPSLLSRLFPGIVGSSKAARSDGEDHDDNDIVPIDGTIDLRYGDLAGTMGPQDVFGEMSCLNLAPRSATVIAKSDCKMIEMLRNIYEILLRTDTFKARMHEIYRERALVMYFENLPFLKGMEKEDLNRLRDEVELVMFEPGEVICAEGDEADAMYIIRLGQVKVSHQAAGGERTLAYMTKGDVFGETGLLRGNRRNATCAAVDHPMVDGGRRRRSGPVELVKISRDVFNWVIRKYPQVRGRLERIAGARTSRRDKFDKTQATHLESAQIESLGLLQGQNLMLIDLDRCTRCDQCVDACVTAHDDGMTRLVREGPRYDRFLVPSSCRQCRDPVCMIGCPVASIRRTPTLNIMIEDWCIGCEICAKQCPYDSIQMHDLSAFDGAQEDADQRADVTQRAVVCDQCNHLPTGPACVYSCPHDAAFRVDAVPFLAESEDAG